MAGTPLTNSKFYFKLKSTKLFFEKEEQKIAKAVVRRVQISIEDVQQIPQGFSAIPWRYREIGGEISSAISQKIQKLGLSFSL